MTGFEGTCGPQFMVKFAAQCLDANAKAGSRSLALERGAYWTRV